MEQSGLCSKAADEIARLEEQVLALQHIADRDEEEIKHLREIFRYIQAHGDENGKVPYSWGQEYAERFIKLAKQEWERK
jgi:hypothetical protein